MAVGLLALGLGCGEGTAPPPPVATVTIDAPAPLDLVPGGTKMLSVVPKDAKGTALLDRTVTWTIVSIMLQVTPP